MFDRNERALSVLQTVVADFIRSESNSSPLITVTKISTSPDFREAKIFVTVYPDSKEEEVIIFLKRKGSDLRDYIKSHARLRSIPFFEFLIDYGERNRQHIDKVAEEIAKADEQK